MQLHGRSLAEEDLPEAGDATPVHAHGELVEVLLGQLQLGGVDVAEVSDPVGGLQTAGAVRVEEGESQEGAGAVGGCLSWGGGGVGWEVYGDDLCTKGMQATN